MELTEADLKGLSEYKYHSVPGTFLDDVFNEHVWSPAARYIPRIIHPNTLTLTGLILSSIVAYVPLIWSTGNFVDPAPRSYYLISAVALFLYQTLDAIDGKQARRLGLSGPLGQIFDHGCDSLTVFCASFVAAHALGLGRTPRMTLNLLGLTLQLFGYHWYEHTHRVFRSSTGQLGVTEGQLLLTLELVAVATVPSLLKTRPLAFIPQLASYYPFNANLGELGFDFSLVLLYWMVFRDVFEVMRNGHWRSCWSMFLLHGVCNAILVSGRLIEEHPISITALIAFSGSLVAIKLIVAVVVHKPPFTLLPFRQPSTALLDIHAFLFYAYSILHFLGSTNSLLLHVVLADAVIGWLLFVYKTVKAIRDYLGISVFIVPGAKTSPPRKRAVKSSASQRSSSRKGAQAVSRELARTKRREFEAESGPEADFPSPSDNSSGGSDTGGMVCHSGWTPRVGSLTESLAAADG